MELKLGQFNRLKIAKEVDFGLYLDAGENYEEILLPTRYVPETYTIGEELDVFLYLDIDERLIATTLTPYIQVGEFGYLEVSWTNEYGAFLNWGLMKDLFVPFREQKMTMEIGNKYIVYAYVDEESYRIVGTAKVEKHLSKEMPPFNEGDPVDVLIWQKTDLGFKAIINNEYAGLIYDNEVFQPLYTGMRLQAFIKQVRPDGKVDLLLQKVGRSQVLDFSDTLIQYISDNGGETSFNDKSAAEDIYEVFGVSKKVFKKAVGELYKRKQIILEPGKIRLNKRK